MATLNQIAYNILNKLEGGRTTQESFISLDQIKYNVNYYRAVILHRDLENERMQDEHFYQEIEAQLAYDSKGVYKSELHLPKILRLSHRFPIRVTSKSITYPFVPYNVTRLWGQSKYVSADRKSYAKNGHLYLDSPTYITKATVRAIFENPSEAYIFGGYDPEKVDDLEYPMSLDVVQRLSENIIQKDFELLQIPPDVTKDNLPNTATQNE